MWPRCNVFRGAPAAGSHLGSGGQMDPAAPGSAGQQRDRPRELGQGALDWTVRVPPCRLNPLAALSGMEGTEPTAGTREEPNANLQAPQTLRLLQPHVARSQCQWLLLGKKAL